MEATGCPVSFGAIFSYFHAWKPTPSYQKLRPLKITLNLKPIPFPVPLAHQLDKATDKKQSYHEESQARR